MEKKTQTFFEQKTQTFFGKKTQTFFEKKNTNFLGQTRGRTNMVQYHDTIRMVNFINPPSTIGIVVDLYPLYQVSLPSVNQGSWQPRSQGFHMRTRRDTRKPWSGPVT